MATKEERKPAGEHGLCAPRVISNVPGCRDSTLMERVALTPAFTRQARRSSGIGERASFERLKWIHVVELYGRSQLAPQHG